MDLRKLSKVTDSFILDERICDSELDQLVEQVWDEISGIAEAGGVEAGEIEGLNVDVFIQSEYWPEITISVGGESRTWDADEYENEEELYEEQKNFIREELSKQKFEDEPGEQVVEGLKDADHPDIKFLEGKGFNVTEVTAWGAIVVNNFWKVVPKKYWPGLDKDIDEWWDENIGHNWGFQPYGDARNNLWLLENYDD